MRKRQEGTVHPDRNEQFEHINATADRFLAAGQPVISVDTKKKELVGNFANAGREWQPKATPPAVRVHDFPSDAEGKAIPYGVFDMARNEAWVSVGCDHDTPTFAVASIRHWWQRMGQSAYPEATTPYITADAGGSNGYRSRSWKHELQKLADETRLFCHITANWRGTPLTTYETIVDRIGNTRTEAGLQVQAALDTGEYPTGVTVTQSEMDALALVPDELIVFDSSPPQWAHALPRVPRSRPAPRVPFPAPVETPSPEVANARIEGPARVIVPLVEPPDHTALAIPETPAPLAPAGAIRLNPRLRDAPEQDASH